MNSLFVKEDGLIYVNEVPEEHFSKGCHTELLCESESLAFAEQFCGCYNHYQQELASAKSTAVLCADQEQAKEILFVRRCIFPKEIALKQATGIYPIEGLKFEVKEELYMDNAFRSRKVANLSLEEK